jgi:hypothetical protein
MKHLAKIQTEFLKIAADDMSGTVHNEHEQRLELAELPTECNDVEPTIIKQGKLKEIKNGNDVISYVRVRMKKEADKEPVYSLGVKQFPLHQEAETEISKEMFDSFYPDNVDKPQEKLRYSLSSGWDVDDIKQDNKIIAECEHAKSEKVTIPKHWNVKKIFKFANLMNDMEVSEAKPLKTSVFLGGDTTDDDNQWRQTVKKMFRDIIFLDPFDDDWKAKNNIYDECAAMVKADKIVFYRGGELTQKEKDFLSSIDKQFVVFNDLQSVIQYLEKL